MEFNLIYFLLLIFPIIHLFFYQIKNFDLNNSNVCLKYLKVIIILV